MTFAKPTNFTVNRTLLTAIFSHVEISTKYSYRDDRCWEWTGVRDVNGYGRFFYQYNNYSAHRTVYELFVNSIKENQHADHLCRVRHCVNPGHLEPVSPRVNILRGFGACAQNIQKAYCPSGHPYDKNNTYAPTGKNGHKQRYCRQCSVQKLDRFFLKVAALGPTHPQYQKYIAYVPGAIKKAEAVLAKI